MKNNTKQRELQQKYTSVRRTKHGTFFVQPTLTLLICLASLEYFALVTIIHLKVEVTHASLPVKTSTNICYERRKSCNI